MRARSSAAIAIIALLFVGALIVPRGAVAQATTPPACPTPPDVTDPNNDHTSFASVSQTDAVTGFQQIDLVTGCIEETATAFAFIGTTAQAPAAGSAMNWVFNFHFKVNGSDIVAKVSQSNGATTITTTPTIPGSTATIAGTQVTALLPRGGVKVSSGGFLSDFFIDSQGTFVPPAGGIVTGADRAPNTGTVFPAASGPYQAGSRAPSSLDSDGDGVPDRSEIANGTNPNSLDTDHDGLLDGASVEVQKGSPNETKYKDAGIYILRSDNSLTVFAGEKEFGTNATRPDTDGDGLLDGGNVTTPSGGNVSTYFGTFGLSPYSQQGGNDTFLGELPFGASPTQLDTDSDGRNDYLEVTGVGNEYTNDSFFPQLPGSTNPKVADSDGDGLTDGEEIDGLATLPNGTQVHFAPTDPNGADTDHDGINDLDELLGSQQDAKTGNPLTFPPTDPTKADSDGDGYNDGMEVQAKTNPMDPNSHPGSGGSSSPSGDAGYLWLSTVAMLVVGLLCVVGILVRWG